jgi:hypothetical protein
MIPLKQAEAKERQRVAGGDRGNQYTGGKVAVVMTSSEAPERAPSTRKQVADAVGISEWQVQKLIRIAKASPEKVAQIKKGEVTVKQAMREIKPPKEPPAASVKVNPSPDVERGTPRIRGSASFYTYLSILVKK